MFPAGSKEGVVVILLLLWFVVVVWTLLYIFFFSLIHTFRTGYAQSCVKIYSLHIIQLTFEASKSQWIRGPLRGSRTL